MSETRIKDAEFFLSTRVGGCTLPESRMTGVGTGLERREISEGLRTSLVHEDFPLHMPAFKILMKC